MAAASGWVMFALVVVGLLGVVPFISGESVSVLSILKASKEAIESYDVERNMEIVHKHYFTTTKEQSMWYHVIKEGGELFSTEFGTDELVFFEKLIQKVSTHYHTCMMMLPGMNKAQCFFHISSMLADLEVGVRWELAPDFQLRPDEAKLGLFYTSVGMLTAHISIIATDSFESFKKIKISKERIKPFIKILSEIQANLYYHVKDVKIWLLDQVSPATICQETELLWKTFEQSCETRWIATAAERQDARVFVHDLEEKGPRVGNQQVGNQSSSNRRAHIVVMPESPEIVKETDRSFESDYMNAEDMSVLKIIDALGGNKGKQETRFHVHVEDYLTKEIIFEEYASAIPTSKGQVMDTLSRHALEARSKYMQTFSQKLELTKESTALTKSVLNTAVVHVKTLFKDQFFPN